MAGILTLPHTCCVTLGQSLDLSDLSVSSLQFSSGDRNEEIHLGSTVLAPSTTALLHLGRSLSFAGPQT